jgi:signal transduction histidine kinase/FixJ family two-component response regulator
MSNKLDILLIDDRPENLVALEALLTSPDYNLVKATSGEAALKHLLEGSPALILMDIQMPGLDGFETAALIKGNERTRNIPIIFVTAMNADQRFVHQGYDYGAVDYVYKPYDGYVLRSKVAVFVEIHRQHQRMARLVAVQQAATDALGNAPDMGEAIAQVIASACNILGWQAALLWEVGQGDGTLRCFAQWHASSGANAAAGSDWPRQALPLGSYLPGYVWQNQKPVWVSRSGEGDPLEAFVLPGCERMQTAVGVPVAVHREVIGVLELYSATQTDPDASLLEIMAAIGGQLGQAIKRDQAVRNGLEAIRSRDVFFSIASHELKTPITSLKMMLQLAQRGVDAQRNVTLPAPKLAKTLSISIKQVNQLTRLVEDMLDVVKIRGGHLQFDKQMTDLSTLIESVLDRYAGAMLAAQCEVHCDIDGGVVGLWDPIRLEQVVVNLLANAIKYAPGAPIDIKLGRQGDSARLVVRDYGPGIPADKRRAVFQRFERGNALRSIGGLGLGLFIVKHVVEAHGGTVNLDGEDGQGSTFTISLPLAADVACEDNVRLPSLHMLYEDDESPPSWGGSSTPITATRCDK